MNSHWTALNTTEFSYQIWSCPIFLLKPKRADWLMCFRLLRWIFMSLLWLVCRNLMGSYEFVLWWCDQWVSQNIDDHVLLSFFIILMNEKRVSISVYLENKTTIIRLSPCVHITFWTVTFRFFMNVNFTRHRRMLTHLCRIRVLWFPLKCTRKGIYKQHLLCNTPLLKLNQLESGSHIPDTSHVHSLNTLNGCDRQWQRRGENYVLAHHFTLNRLGGYPRTSVWQSLSRKWSTSVALKYFTKDHSPPWRCSDVITDHWSFLSSFDEEVNTEIYERVQIENTTDHHVSFDKAPYL